MTDDLVNAEGLADWLGVTNSAVQDAMLRGVLTKPAEAKGRLARAQAEVSARKLAADETE